ncbi:hypothetical protein LMG28688_05326 [Paraburkholderia caffeinitolerans]|uniref:Uncharacterized protein n=1 Tax=Paraburkholderia caffeinitolerans TaxID=1723730 RepID=A0A6J5GLL9_9BURK|nr:ABC transporter permease [Paraburkholderia caffeinitolerans]CAB3801331.1 hypothetical protein LMG28688_05326 [Paraburkholderia caffeinitolerans]
MRDGIRRLFWVEVGLATITGLLAIVTAIVPDWIEFVSGWDPDRGDGSVEWLVVAGLGLVTIVLSVAAMKTWRRAAAMVSIDHLERR